MGELIQTGATARKVPGVKKGFSAWRERDLLNLLTYSTA